MQFDRQPDGTDKPLNKQVLIPAWALSGLCAVVQDKDSVYQTDIFAPIIASIEQLTGKVYAQQDETTSSISCAC